MLVLPKRFPNIYPRCILKSKHILYPTQVPTEGFYIGHITPATFLHPCALRCFRSALDSDNDVIYCDQLTKQRREGEPKFLLRPGFDPKFLQSQHYTGDVIIFKPTLISETQRQLWYHGKIPLYEMVLLLSERTNRFHRLPMFLYAAKQQQYTTENYKILHRYLTKHTTEVAVTKGITAMISRIVYPVPVNSKVSIIIPNRDHLDDLRTCISSIQERSTWKNYEIIIVENGSTEKTLFTYYDEIERTGKAKILYWTKPYNFAAICNHAARCAVGNYLLFLNNDMEIITHNWLEEMIMHAQLPGTGAVGAKLLYPDNSIQHGGVIIGIAGIAGHAYKHLPSNSMRNMGQLQSVHSCSAVTGACMMVEKQRYFSVSGMDESFAVAYNDIDFCLRLQETGLRNVYTPYAILYHYESKTRGAEIGANKKRFEQEAALMQQRWHRQLELGDPYHHPYYDRYDEQYTLL